MKRVSSLPSTRARPETPPVSQPPAMASPRRVAVALVLSFPLPSSSSSSLQEPTFLLVSSRKKDNRYVFPKGGVEQGESPAFAACREAWEEARPFPPLLIPVKSCADTRMHAGRSRPRLSNPPHPPPHPPRPLAAHPLPLVRPGFPLVRPLVRVQLRALRPPRPCFSLPFSLPLDNTLLDLHLHFHLDLGLTPRDMARVARAASETRTRLEGCRGDHGVGTTRRRHAGGDREGESLGRGMAEERGEGRRCSWTSGGRGG